MGKKNRTKVKIIVAVIAAVIAAGGFVMYLIFGNDGKNAPGSNVVLDVFEQETKVGPNLRSNGELDKASPLYRLSQAKNVILTPHNAFNTAEAVQRKSQQSVEQLKHFLENGTFIWPI